MEFLEGEELRQLIAHTRNVFLENKLVMMIEVCDGLDYARIATAEAGLTRTGLIMGRLGARRSSSATRAMRCRTSTG